MLKLIWWAFGRDKFLNFFDGHWKPKKLKKGINFYEQKTKLKNYSLSLDKSILYTNVILRPYNIYDSVIGLPSSSDCAVKTES